MPRQTAVDRENWAKWPLRLVEVDSSASKSPEAQPQLVLDEKALLRDAARRLLCRGQLSTDELYREFTRSNDYKPHSRTRSLVRPILIGLAVFAVWFVASIATYQENPGDMPTIWRYLQNRPRPKLVGWCGPGNVPIGYQSCPVRHEQTREPPPQPRPSS